MRGWNFNTFIPVSIGFHLFLLSVLSLSFPDFRINRVPPPDIEVTLLPAVLSTMEIEKPVPKAAPPKPMVELKKEEPPPPSVRKEEPRQPENLPLPLTKEDPVPQEPLLPKSPAPVETVVMKPPVEQPEPTTPKNLIKQEEKQENQVKRAEVKEMENTVSTTITAASLPEAISIIGLKESAPSLKEASSKEEARSVSILSSYSRERTNNPVSDNGSQGGSTALVKPGSQSNGEVPFVGVKVRKSVEAVYPIEAKEKGLEGKVLLRVEVLSSGLVGQIELKKSSGHTSLDQSAVSAMKQYEFFPAKRGEAPVSVWVSIPFKFEVNTRKTLINIPGRSR
jgi:protein TonB